MYRRISSIMFPIVTIALIITAAWGFNEVQKRNKIMVKAENQYQRSFHNLSYHVDRLHTELGNTLAMNSTSTDTYRKGLVNIWRITSEARNEMTQMPLMGMEFNKTDEFLANLSNFSYRAGIRNFSEKPLTDKESEMLQSLYGHSTEISDMLRGMQDKVLAKGVSWADVEMKLSQNKGPQDNLILDGFQTMEKQVSEYKDVEFDPSIVNIHQTHDKSKLTGTDATVEDIKKKAAEFWAVDPGNVKVVENGTKDSKYQSYSANITSSDGKSTNQMDYTRKGGHPIFYMNPREVGAATKSVDEAIEIAKGFLDKHDYKNMQAVSYDDYQNVANLTFATLQDDVIIYPEKLVIRIALDNGDITGLQASDYVYNMNKKREIKKPAITVEQARKSLSPKLKISRERLAVIQNDVRDEVLCYEFAGTMNKTQYRVFINSSSGNEEKVESLEDKDKDAGK
ncbi:germination protein YpeB [Paenibacillus sp. N1-5-1-14]|uniref:germination protein YpeB n=1 Tax=Paenibacillus radicibacter TaxID=2972488 RepID=UPI00215910D5|nr:germination protein YpeB [Paenibacillus radicibacter]MCR8642319.1 germination protein YpeB [Paenibacillus radicibacter]